MGSAFRLPVWFGPTYDDALAWCRERGIHTICADVHASTGYDQVDWQRPSALILGPESSGLSPDEISVANAAVRNLIRENQVHQLENNIQTGRKEGMTLMDNCLYDLYCKCLITYDTAVSRARHPDRIMKQRA